MVLVDTEDTSIYLIFGIAKVSDLNALWALGGVSML